MKIKEFNSDTGSWTLIERIERPVILVERRFLWWSWEEKKHIPLKDYCIKAVNRAKYLSIGKKIIRVMFGSDIIWQNWEWYIDTNTYTE